MFPNAPGQGVNLEDRLRGLILNNANTNPELNGGPLRNVQQPGDQYGSDPTRQSENAPGNPSNSQDAAGQQSRKRPNQAQRRQMNSQLSIPIDPRPSHGAQAGRGPGPNTPFGAGNVNNRGQHQNYRPHHQQYSPRFQQGGPGSPYSPRSPFPQASPQSPMPPYQGGPSPQFQSRQGPVQFQQLPQLQANAYARPLPPQNRQLYQPGPSSMNSRGRQSGHYSDDFLPQAFLLDSMVQNVVPDVGIDAHEEADKEAFRALVETACREAITEYEQQESGNQKFDALSVELRCFGSMRSGFATKASDMDLALLTPRSHPAPDSPESPIPRLLEKKLLNLGYGARLLTRTRVPIIKLCQRPTEKLLADLREERMKWESGFAEEEDEENELNTPEPVAISEDASKVKSEDRPGTATSDTSNKAKPSGNHEKSSSLKQKENQSLGDYHNAAKRYLRKLGGRDLTTSSPPLNDEEGEILNRVCKAFITGLFSKELSSRLQTYKSISPLFDESVPFLLRSLQGVVTQAEGERLAMAWESRILKEPTEARESEYLELVESWRTLQGVLGNVTDPLLYNRQLYFAAEKLKRIASLQVVFLEQIQHEEPVYYQTRAQKIMEELRARDQSSEEISTIIVAQYIKGISNSEIRAALQSHDHTGMTLGLVAIHHRALHLAVDYEHALKSGVFDNTHRGDVEQYIALLRGLKVDSQNGPQVHIDDVLLAKIRSLPDPTEISPSKPRDRYKDHLEFPKTDIGIQCDINFSAHLAIHNTQLLRCYSVSDPRVKPMVLFVKNWAKKRGINTPYRGTLSSYGYVLMVLHYLVNVAQPFVCPNLQLVQKDPPHTLSPAEIAARTTCQGRDVRFWRNEAEIRNLAERKMLNHNHDPTGMLLRGFFEYFAQNGQMTTVQSRGFDWGREVLSLRTPSGILTKQEKGWVGAKTVVETTTVAAPPTPSTAKPTTPTESTADGAEEVKTPKTPKTHTKTVEETKEIRHRYLFAIEDPFELDHNVARTVTHNGIVSIRDEFRRAWRIIRSVRKPYEGQEGGLLDAQSKKDSEKGFHELLNLLHGPAPKNAAKAAKDA
ncbi:related to caffeine-induced death protein 1 Cid1 [Phialocephala subalpina]|uniref:Related to caffeine-induced death protein 1 Cid1 n=1 Tax=Phialocephala subalpina TaxID=576137 RepID=A0A1L7XGF6_9HELO|nr:related to caffeine-induced death protein 1 Cid1 [Phialocephala subalpina]